MASYIGRRKPIRGGSLIEKAAKQFEKKANGRRYERVALVLRRRWNACAPRLAPLRRVRSL